MTSSRITFSAAAAIAGDFPDIDDGDEPGEEIESAPPLRVGEERLINSSGLKKKLLKAGRGWETPVSGDEVTVHCVGILLDGTKFEDTTDGQPLTFILGSGQVVPGLDHGIATMRKGETALFVLPSALAYGNTGARGVPPGADLLFEVELLSWLTVVDICKDSGIVKKVLYHGGGEQTGDLDEVTVKYQARLLDGSVVAESPEGGLQFYVNEGLLCPALPKVIKTMRRGENAVVMVQPQYAFGNHGRAADTGCPAIPPNSTLAIDVELLSLKHVIDVTGDMKVLKKVLKAGEGIRRPNDGETVCIRYTAMLEDGTVFGKSGSNGELLEFVLDEEQVVAGLDRAVATMLKDELSQVTVKAEYGFGNDEVKHADVTIPACSTLVYTVELVDFIKEKELREMSSIEKIDAAENAKGVGNDLYKIGKFHRAGKKYDKAAAYVNDDESFDDGDKQLVKSLRVSCWLNHAACSLKLKDFHGAIMLCSKVLDVELYNVKALYRRAQAYMENADFDLAKLDIQKALNVEPHNREVKVLQTTLKQLQAESNKRDAKLYANMFEWMRKDTDVSLKRLKVERVQDVKREEVHAMDTGILLNSESQDVHEDSRSDSTEAQIIDKKTASVGAAL